MASLKTYLELIVQVLELISTGILLIGFFKAFGGFLASEWRRLARQNHENDLSHLRRQLGAYILLGLDFYIVSDIIHSMIKPDLKDLLNLGIIVLLRTTIGFFLGKEIAEIEKRESEIHS